MVLMLYLSILNIRVSESTTSTLLIELGVCVYGHVISTAICQYGVLMLCLFCLFLRRKWLNLKDNGGINGLCVRVSSNRSNISFVITLSGHQV